MDYQALLDHIREEVKPHFGRGTVADYIPALRKVPRTKFGMALAALDGSYAYAGDAHEPFSIQSISKLFSLMLAMSRYGDEVWTLVGKEPSGTAFNSLVQLEHEKGIPRNPFINAGALIVVDRLMQGTDDVVSTVTGYARFLSQNFQIDVDRKVALSERRAGFTNAAIANLLKSHGRIQGSVDALLKAYCAQCSLAASCADLAKTFLPLANNGISPLVNEAILTARQTKRVNALMLTCGMYDATGNFAFRVGLPAKSGVGGGIVAVMPGEFSVAVWSPELDRSGNSLVGTAALELLTSLSGKSIF